MCSHVTGSLVSVYFIEVGFQKFLFHPIITGMYHLQHIFVPISEGINAMGMLSSRLKIKMSRILEPKRI